MLKDRSNALVDVKYSNRQKLYFQNSSYNILEKKKVSLGYSGFQSSET